MREYLLCLMAAAAVTYLLTSPVVRLAFRFKAVAVPRARDVHKEPVAKWGGLAMYGGLVAGLVLASKLPMMRAVFKGDRQALAVLAGATIIVLLGLADDKWGLDAPTKFAGQALAAGVMALLGIQIIWLPLGGAFALSPSTSVLLTVLVVVVTVNAINFVDGLDGLAAGIVAIAALALFAYSYLLSVEFGFERAALATLICALLAGMCAGFLPHNFSPAKLFMGDTGSMLIGLLLSASVITLTGQLDPNALAGQELFPTLLPLMLPAAVMAVPLLDMALAVQRRTRSGRSMFAPDKEHLHHQLVDLGHSDRRAVSLMHAWAALISFAAVGLAFMPWPIVAALFTVGVLVLVVAVRWPGSRSSLSALG